MMSKIVLSPAYISFGGNINPRQHFKNALKMLERDFQDVVCSSVYQSEAVGFDGEDFLNLVVKLDSHLSVGQLNDYLHDLESKEGRKRLQGKAWDSRTLDLDILLFGNLVGCIDGVDLPRGEILEHAHVLMPLAEIAGDLIHQPSNKSYQDLLLSSHFDQQKIWKVEL